MASKVFIGATKENAGALDMLVLLLGRMGIKTLRWTTAVEKGGVVSTELLATDKKKIDFAVLIMTPDDNLELRKEHYIAPRDNLVFEAGLYTSALGHDRVILLVPETVDPVRLPTDFAGFKYVKYKAPQGKLQGLSQERLKEALEPPAEEIRNKVETLGPAQRRFGAPTRTIAIYPNYESPPKKWFAAFDEAIKQAIENKISFPPPVLYGGPGSAIFWSDLERGTFTSEHRGNFRNGIPGATRAALQDLSPSDVLTIVDLGIGTLDAGRQVHSMIRDQNHTIINYVGVDVSLEMLHQATSDMRDMADTGAVHGIHSDFYELKKVADLLPESDRRIFMLLGNTLGNENNPRRLLSRIAGVMSNEDRLILELQLLSEAPPNEEIFIKFYMGPFLYAGFGPDDMVCNRHTAVSASDQVVSFIVTTKKSRQIAHHSFNLDIREGDYTTHFVRKFSISWIKEMVEGSGLKFDYPQTMPADEPTSAARRFGYFVLRK